MMRGREERRAPARGDFDRSDRRGPKNSRRSRSRSPIKSKLMAMAMAGRKDHKTGSTVTKSIKTRRISDHSRERDRDDIKKKRLRMDEMEEKLNKKGRSPPEPRRSDSGFKKKPATNLDKVVKKAREERTNYWDKKILEAEDKDPQRWGHSGFKELYQKDNKPKRRSRSGSIIRKSHKSPSPGFSRHRPSRSRSPMKRSYSRSRSPINRIAKSRKDIRSFTRSRSPEIYSSKSKHGNKESKLKGTSARPLSKPSFGTKSSSKGHSRLDRNPTLNRPISKSQGKTSSRSNNAAISTSGFPKKNMARRRSSSFSSSGSSISRSRSRSGSYHAPPKRLSGGLKPPKGKDVRGRRASDSFSSSTSSDEDVLQLHARRGRGRSSSMSYSDSGSSSISGSPRVGVNRVTRHSSSSSSSSISGSSSDSDSDESVRTKPQPPKITVGNKDKQLSLKKGLTTTPAQKATPTPTGSKPKVAAKAKPTIAPLEAANKGPSSSSTVLKQPQSQQSPKRIAAEGSKSSTGANSGNLISKAATAKPTVVVSTSEKGKELKEPKKPTQKSPSESGETESETESSDSDSEPRMTLSERFAKLSQMSTDKREMAKPILSVNEIDTKMRVVKDFRNPEAPKVYVAGDGVPPQSNDKMKSRLRSPPQYPRDDDKRDLSEERRRRFERMYRDAPAERPMDWSDSRVRYNYYKNRGCFDERPINFEDYVKWEDWYHKYREWLENEGYYDGRPAPPPTNTENWSYEPGPGQMGPGPGRPENINRMHMNPNNNYPPGRRMEPMVGGPPLSSRSHFGRPEGNAYLETQQRIGRRIDRTPGGSLVVNIRQGGPFNNGNGFDARRRIGGGLGPRPR